MTAETPASPKPPRVPRHAIKTAIRNLRHGESYLIREPYVYSFRATARRLRMVVSVTQEWVGATLRYRVALALPKPARMTFRDLQHPESASSRNSRQLSLDRNRRRAA